MAALLAFFSYALVAKDIYFSIQEFKPGDDVVRYVEWNTSAREALLTVVLLLPVAGFVAAFILGLYLPRD
jgi:hypothetical protein